MRHKVENRGSYFSPKVVDNLSDIHLIVRITFDSLSCQCLTIHSPYLINIITKFIRFMCIQIRKAD